MTIAHDHCSILHAAAAVADRLQFQILIMNLSNVKELHEAAKAVFTTTKKIFGAQARYSRDAIVGGMAVTHLTNYHRVIKVSMRASNYVCLIFNPLCRRMSTYSLGAICCLRS
jgi:hypothetical protein